MSKITAYGTLTAPQANDVIPIVDVNDTTMAPSGTTKKITAGNLLQGVAIPPSGDTSGATDTNAINAIAQAGKMALLQAGTYYTTHLLPDSYGGIAGVGPATVLQAVSGTTGYMVALKTPGTTKQVTVRNLTLIPNTGTLGGIQFVNTGWAGGNPDDELHLLENVLVLQAAGDGYHLDTFDQETRLINCKAYECLGNGFYLGNNGGSGTGCVDARLVACTAGNNAGHGFNVLGGTSCDFVACKAFGSGWNYQTTTRGTTQCGFEIGSSVQIARFTGCSAQQNALHGFDLQGCSFVAVTGCDSDTNSAGPSVTTGVGINTNGAQNCAIVGNTGNNNLALGLGAQKYGYQVAGTQTGTWFLGNTITGSSGIFNYVSGGGYIRVDSSDADLGSIITTVGPFQIRGTAAQTLTNGATIALNFAGNGSATVTAAGNITGLILAQPNIFATGQITAVSNESAFTLTFAASGTSAVAAGTAAVIPAFSVKFFYWDQATSLWYMS